MTRGVVYAEAGAEPVVEEIVLDPPGPHEVQVRVEACGLCHTDVHVVETGGWGMPFPILLGHEGAGIVEEVGADVTSVQPGDRVVLAWRAPCGDVPLVQARRSAALLVRAARRAARTPCRRTTPLGGAPLRDARRPGDRARGLRGEGSRRASGRAGVRCSRAGSRPAPARRCGRRPSTRAHRSRSSAAAASVLPSSRVRSSPARSGSSPSTSPRRSSTRHVRSARPTSSTHPPAIRSLR